MHCDLFRQILILFINKGRKSQSSVIQIDTCSMKTILKINTVDGCLTSLYFFSI